MKLICFIFLVAINKKLNAQSNTEKLEIQWNDFKSKYDKIYVNSSEENFRKNIFFDNKKIIDLHNSKFVKGKVSYELGVNRNADLSNSEHKNLLTGFGQISYSTDKIRNKTKKSTHNEHLRIPSAIDWRTKGAVTPVKNQGKCGSCWAFSAIGALEGQWFLATGNLISLSEQNLIDCDDYNDGCYSGYMPTAFEYIINNGISTTAQYPYTATYNYCAYKPISEVIVDNYYELNSGDEMELMMNVGEIGPISVAVDASLSTFRFYKSGVYSDSYCSKIKLNHALVAVGYGTANGKSFWIVKNSWGTTWGEKGYMKIERNKNMCGIATMASYPIVKQQ